ncbi:MAG: polyprenol monophosphomannose synthase [Solitalea-like symbiont of Tyrophagus putrescentiae]
MHNTIKQQSDSLIIIPTYNEKENVEAIIRHIFALQERFDILVVDDNSPDKTSEIVKLLQNEFTNRLFLEIRDKKNGLGKAYIHGFKWALNHNYDFIFEMDADFSHNPNDLPKLKQACLDGADLAIGSRYINGINVVNWPMQRVLLSYFASIFVRLVTKMDINDTTAGFKCYKRKVLEGINLDRIKSSGYVFQIEMKFKAIEHGFKIKEIPIIFINRQKGKSKIKANKISESIWSVIKLGIRKRLRLMKS